MSSLTGTSTEFDNAVRAAIDAAQNSPDEAVRFAIHYVPVYVQARPTHDMAVAGGCPSCTYLGLWAQSWPGYTARDLGIQQENWHGVIFMFEEGIRRQGVPLSIQAQQTLFHEIDHALQRDHVLEHLKVAKAQYAAQVRSGCGYCGR